MKRAVAWRRDRPANPGWMLACVLGLGASAGFGGTNLHVAYHWHLHQPIYWPEVNPFAPATNRYQFAADSIALKLANTGNFYPGSPYKHPRNQLVNGDGGEFESVFDKADRVAAYQSRGRDSIQTVLAHPDAGASVSYSGALQENIGSLGRENRYGYTPQWNAGYTEARGSSATWRTSGGFPRADLVGMTYHHALGPLLPRSVLRKEIQIFKHIWWKSWGGHPNLSDHSKGFWPVEAAFSRHMIPVLVEEGYQWVIVANSHLARTCPNYLEVAPRGTSGWNMDPPNRADQLGPVVPAAQWWSGQLDGRGGTFPAPFAYQAHRAKYVNPETGAESSLVLVPMCDLLSYQNGYGPMGTGDLETRIAPFNDPARPSLVLLAHDGDNAWGGGYDYYLRSVPNLFNDAAAKGYRPTTIQQFLADHPVPAGAFVHIEDGAWVNAANDWGHPQFINWLWPPARSPSDPAYRAGDPRTWYDLENGWSEDWRNWAVLIAGANYCETAEQITLTQGGTVEPWKIQEPVQPNGTSNHPNAAEQAWHFYLGGLDSGFMYYGTALDDEVKQTLAVNRAIAFATHVIGTGALDQTPPTVFKPQRFPWNPGGMGWGPLTGYREVGFNGQPPWPADFYIWTLVFDVSGVTNVTLFVRVDADGVNPLADNANETYAGGPGVGPWTAIPMTRRVIPSHNVPGDPNIHFFLLPSAIADHWWARVTGYTNVLLDYYVQAADARGNVHRSEIQHVWVDSGTSTGAGSTNGCSGRVCVVPAPPVAGNAMTVFYNPAGGPLAGAGTVNIHYGWNQWTSGTITDAAMTFDAATNRWRITLTPPAHATQFDCVFNNGSGTWDNNNGADWHFPVLTNPVPQPPAPPTGLSLHPVQTNQINLSWNAAAGATGYLIQRDGAPRAATTGTNYADTGLAANTTYCYSIVASNSVGVSAPTPTRCTNTWASAPTNYPPFVMDGVVDFAGYQLSAHGLTLYAAVRGNRLYVATASPGTAGPNDHFIFVSDQLLPAASAPAPWAKSGAVAVATTKPYLATESLNPYVAWYNAPAGSAAAKSSSPSGHLEGVLDLAAAFGNVPAHLYLAAAAYATADGGALVAQSPAGSGPNLDPAEFWVIPVAALRDHDADGLLDRLDPLRDFQLLGLHATAGGFTLTWAVMPGRTYQLEVATALGAGWSNLPDTLTTAGPLQLELGYLRPLSPDASAQFYRLKRLP